MKLAVAFLLCISTAYCFSVGNRRMGAKGEGDDMEGRPAKGNEDGEMRPPKAMTDERQDDAKGAKECKGPKEGKEGKGPKEGKEGKGPKEGEDAQKRVKRERVPRKARDLRREKVPKA